MARSEMLSPMQSPPIASHLERTPSPRNGTDMKTPSRVSGKGVGNVNDKGKGHQSLGAAPENAGDDDENDESNDDDDDDEAEKPASFAPSHGNNKRRKGHKAGLRKQRMTLSKHNKNKKAKAKAAQTRNPDLGSDFGSGSSVSSVAQDGSADSIKSDDDSDAAYERVNDVSDENEEDLEKEEEDMILETESKRGYLRNADDWMGLAELESQPFYSAGSFFGDEHPLLQSANGDGEDAAVAGAASENVETPVPRRVHFEQSDYSSDSDKTTDDEYPDFLQQDRLDPDLRRMIENDSEPTGHKRNPHDLFVNSDFYDLPGNIYHVESETSVDTSSEYESDGETTDEEDHPPPATITHPRSILRRESSASLTPECEVSTKTSQAPRRRGPPRGTFIADPHKPVAVVAPNGKQLILIPPYASSRHDWLESAANSLAPSANTSPRTSISVPNPLDDSETDAAISPTRRGSTPMLSSGANLMMSALQNNSGGQVMGPPEAFYPGQYPIDGNFDDDEEDDSEGMLNVDDFIDFGNASSVDDEDMGKDFDEPVGLTSPIVSSSLPGSLAPTPSRPGNNPGQANNAEQLLNHLDRGIVTAFRRNHNKYQALIRLPQHREFMPANSPSRAASAFRRSKLSDQKTPTRKRKASTCLSGEAVRRKLLDSQVLNTSALP